MSGLLTAPGERKHLEASEVPEYLPRRVEDVPAGQAEVALEVERREYLAREDARLEIRRVAVHRFDDGVGGCFSRIVPAAAAGERRVEVLAEEARDVFSSWRKTRVDGARDQHLHDGLAGETGGAGVEVGALHVAKRRRDDDPRAVVRLGVLPGRAGKIRELGERDVHAKRARSALPALDSRAEFGVERLRLDQAQVEQLRIDSCGDGARVDLAAVCEGHAGRAPRLYPHGDDLRPGGDFHAA